MPLGFIILDDEKVFDFTIDETLDRLETVRQCAVTRIFFKERKRAKIQSPLPVRSVCDDLNWNVARREISLETVQSHPALIIGRQTDGAGIELPGQRNGIFGTRCDDSLETMLANNLKHVLRGCPAGVDDQQDGIAIL